MQVKKIGILSWKAYAAMFAVVLFGVMSASLVYGRMDTDSLAALFNAQADFISARGELSLSQILLSNLGSSSLFMLVIFLSGFGAIGHVAVTIALYLRGLGTGAVLAQLYSQYAFKGVLYSFATILPGSVLSFSVLALAARESFALSNTYAFYSLSERQTDGIRQSIKIYCAKFLALEAFLVISAGCDCVVSWLFKGFAPK